MASGHRESAEDGTQDYCIANKNEHNILRISASTDRIITKKGVAAFEQQFAFSHCPGCTEGATSPPTRRGSMDILFLDFPARDGGRHSPQT